MPSLARTQHHPLQRCRSIALIAISLASSSAPIAPVALAQPQTATRPSDADDIANAIAEWNLLRALSPDAIDDPLAFLVYESGALRRLALQIQSLQSSRSSDPLDARLQVALLRSLYLAASIDGSEPEPLLRLAIDARNTSDVPRVRAEAAYRVLMADLMRISSKRAWDAPLLPTEWALIDAYLTCYGKTPRAASAVKRVADDASARSNARDLLACRELIDQAANDHPIARTFVGKARGIEAIGAVWTPSLRTLDGQSLNWMGLRGKPTIVILIDISQSPSAELLMELLAPDSQIATDHHLVILQVDVSAVPHTRTPPPESMSDAARVLANVDASRRVRLSRGWREPLLAEFDIRTLPTAFVLDDVGVLRRVIRHNDWSTAKSIRSALRSLEIRRLDGEASASQPAPDS